MDLSGELFFSWNCPYALTMHTQRLVTLYATFEVEYCEFPPLLAKALESSTVEEFTVARVDSTCGGQQFRSDEWISSPDPRTLRRGMMVSNGPPTLR